MAVLLQPDQPVEELGDALARAVLQAAREFRIGKRDRDLLVRDRVAECEVQRRDRESVRVRFPSEEGDEARAGFFERQQRTNYGRECPVR